MASHYTASSPSKETGEAWEQGEKAIVSEEEKGITDTMERKPYGEYNSSGLKRALNPRQLSFISIGAAIGTGIFLGTGEALANGGPLGLLLGYLAMATIVISVLCCVGEMVTFLPLSGGHLTLAGRFVDPAMSAAASLSYVLCWCFVMCAELSASATLVGYWKPSTEVNPGAWIAIFIVFLLLVNILGAKVYGEAEFYFSMLKVITIIGLIIVSIIITAGGGPQGEAIGFRYWRNPGPFVQYKGIGGSSGRFLGWFSVLTQAAFSQIGSEMLALAAAETRNPRKALPQALRTVWIRVSLFYVVSVFMIGLIVSSEDERLGSSSTAAASPFVIAIKDAGITALPSVINAAILTSALSAGCADLFTTSRALHSMASKGQMPAIFARTMRNGIPHYAMIATWSIGLLSLLSISNGSNKAFTFFVNLTAISGVLTWWVIAITYLRFWRGLRAQNISRKTLPWKTPVTPFMAAYVLVFISVLMFFAGWTSVREGQWDPSTCESTEFCMCFTDMPVVFSTYTPLIWFTLFYLIYKFLWKTKIVRASDMDFVSHIAEIEQDAANFALEDEINRPTTLFGRFKRWWG